MMITKNPLITIDSFTEALDEVIAEYGEDHVYARGTKIDENGKEWQEICYYAGPDGSPSCLVGHVLDRLGVEYSGSWEGKDAWTVLDRLDAPGILAQAAAVLQSEQDSGQTWGDARDQYARFLGPHMIRRAS